MKNQVSKANKSKNVEQAISWKQALQANRSLKKEVKTFGGALKLTQLLIDDETIKAELETILKPRSGFNKLKKACRKSKAGNYSPFYVICAVRKLANA